MSNSTDEIKKLQKRLEAAEKAIKQLEGRDLLIAKLIVGAVAPMELNIAARTMGSEEAKSFLQFFSKREGVAKLELASAQTIKSAIDVLIKFDGEISRLYQSRKSQHC